MRAQTLGSAILLSLEVSYYYTKTILIAISTPELLFPKGDQSWVFIGRTDVEGETPILWPPDAKD